MEALFIALMLAVSLGSPATESSREFTPIAVADKGCPLVLRSVRGVDAGEGGVVIIYTVRNPHNTSAEALVVSAAVVDGEGNVRGLQVRPVLKSVTSRTTGDYLARFDRFELKPGEQIVVGIQGVVWSKRQVWHGVLPLAKAPAPISVASGGVK